ncbi:sodium-dependent phosphate transporter 1-like isoform X1 [Mercenaria mercenaria]|uniref:sodium-dependent phosphate transporter 1-like isoform X1 n=1 Tax=Mercenaria mercenaria TaxID=6596 RepID=UPI00234EA39C|nr:sodium-dependent phosphate transporter 1-like isoform X1 [Mercenaria mercenaria]XP_045182255.2 sodium-dependent phosphate transporter 1-like isoform X1 [Mercenaria mercenaria]XP_053382651.1 sodium-dependent phosphate transporter 1-like isoform X1 [Mercenaria mercenaria]
MVLYDDTWLWLVILGFIIAFVLAFGLGANDVANAFGTSVGAKVLTIRQACILGTIFEILGAILVGAKVSNTIRKGIISPELYTNGTEDVFMAGNVAALTGSCIWLMVATLFGLPVSGTHSIVGATLGFSMVVNGVKGIGWVKLAMIAASWFISPLMSGIVSSLLFKFIDILILSKEKPLEYGLRLLPIFYAFTLAVNLFSVFYKGSELLHFNKIPLYGTLILTFGPALIVALLVKIFLVPRQRTKIQKQCKKLLEEEDHVATTIPVTTIEEAGNQEITTHFFDKDKNRRENVKHITEGDDSKLKRSLLGVNAEQKSTLDEKVPLSSETETTDVDIEIAEEGDTNAEKKDQSMARDNVKDKPETAGLFSFLQILTAVFGSFAHGGNDVSNAVGPLVALWVTATTGSAAQKVPVPIWVLVYGGVGISFGLWILGRRVMKTMGEDLTKITPSSGFCIEVGSALTVIVASSIGIPISTTHCKVGSVVCVGRVRSRESVDWRLFRNIILAWCVTLPVSGGLSALAMLGYRAILNALR